jgi:hypothetical protein
VELDQIKIVPVESITPHPDNPRRGNTDVIASSLKAFGQYKPVVVQASTGHILAGNHTWQAHKSNGNDTIAAVMLDVDDVTAKQILLGDNRTSDLGDYDNETLRLVLAQLAADNVDLSIIGYDPQDLDELLKDLEDEPTPDGDGPDGDYTGSKGSLSKRFLIPPFSVIDTRTGWWGDRKRAWLERGIEPEAGRDGGLAFHTNEDYFRKVKNNTSSFDPVLAELAYSWFTPPGGRVLDPFAGGPPRGLVASHLGLFYYGCDLSARQVEANRIVGADYTRRWGGVEPDWTHGDSRKWVSTLETGSFDMILTCPPYYDLERYSDDPADLSAMSTAGFDEAYAEIIAGCGRALANDRFAVFVVGSARDSNGELRDLRAATHRAANAAGLWLHSEAVLLNHVGNAAMRAAHGFPRTRVLTRCHQEVLVFVKGDASRAASGCSLVDVEDALTDAKKAPAGEDDDE